MTSAEPDGYAPPSGSAFPDPVAADLAPAAPVTLRDLVIGEGQPVTVFAHGLGESIAAARPLGTGLSGTRVFFDFRGHGGSVAARPDQVEWGYPALANDLRTVADAHGATRAVGTSMGAAALLHLLTQTPDRFERLVFFLPAALDTVRPEGRARLDELARLVDAGHAEPLASALLAYLPAAVRNSRVAAVHARGSAAELVGTDVSRVMRAIGGGAPLAGLDSLASVQAPALVIGQEGDDVHRLVVARRLAAALPRGRLEVFGPGGALWQDRRRLRAVLGEFLGPDAQGK
jgi:pimeloyl-ACP methyl ester carboxylesterase